MNAQAPRGASFTDSHSRRGNTPAHPDVATVAGPPPETQRRYRGQSFVERRAEQRRRLVRAAIDEFAARGYHNTSVEDIVRAARTSRTAFYAQFDDREDAMYAAVHSSLGAVLHATRTALRNADPEQRPSEVVVGAFVESLVTDASAARIILLESVGISAEVNALRSRLRLELADVLSGHSPGDGDVQRNATDNAIRAAMFGLVFEPMVHLAETNRLAEATSHIPALVAAVDRLVQR